MKTYDVISIGSASLDFFISTTSKQLTYSSRNHERLACVPIGSKLLLDELHYDVGGSGINTSISFSRLGLRAAFLGKIGNDFQARVILDRLFRENVDFLGVSNKGKTGTSVILSHLLNNRTIFTYRGLNNSFLEKDVSWKKLRAKWFYFGSLLDKSWKTELALVRFAKKRGIKIFFNPSFYLAEQGEKKLAPILSACDVLTLNKEEAEALTRKRVPVKQLLVLLARIVPLVVITDGPKGAFAYNGITFYSIVPKDVPIADTTGAGDSFGSAFLAALMLKKDIPTALCWAAAQANSVVQYFGSTNKLLSRKEIARYSLHTGKLLEEHNNARYA